MSGGSIKCGGHCYGMAQATIMYWDTPWEKPVAEDTYDMEKWEVALDIHDHHVRQLQLALDRLFSASSPRSAYEGVKARLSSIPVRPAILSFRTEEGGHSVVAYKVVEAGDRKAIFVYDNNHPLVPTDTAAEVFTIGGTMNAFWYESDWVFEATAEDPVRSKQDVTAAIIDRVFERLVGKLILEHWNQVFFTWGEGGGQGTGASSSNPQSDFIVADSHGRRIGYSGGTFLDEIPGAAFTEMDGAFYLTLPAEEDYVLSTIGTGTGDVSLSLLIPVGGWISQETVFGSFALPVDSTATISFGQETEDWRVQVEGNPDVLPSVDERIEVSMPPQLYLPVILR
jgi:hypothetical protein